MMNTWAMPSPFQASSEGIKAGFWIIAPMALRASACPLCVCAPDGQPLKVQLGLSGEAL
jgi:hypothetical protein